MLDWKDKNKRKGIIITTGVHAVLFVLFIFFGLSYLEPKPEEGIAISLGVVGEGAPSEMPQVKETNEENNEAVQEEQQEVQEVEQVEELATQDLVEAPVIEQEKEPTKEEQEPTPDPKPDEQAAAALDKLSNLKNSPNGKTEGSEVQGRPEGEDFTSNFDKPDGLGNLGEGYYLNGRNPLSTPKPDYPCSAKGKVVVEVKVSRSGDVMLAVAGAKGSTSTDPCLLREAEKAAKATKWQPDINAVEGQVGYIVYIFKRN